MVSHCANPVCHKPLHYLREGKVFLFSKKSASGDALPHRLEHFWLCGICAKEWTLTMDGDAMKLVQTRRKRRLRSGYAVASAAPAS